MLCLLIIITLLAFAVLIKILILLFGKMWVSMVKLHKSKLTHPLQRTHFYAQLLCI